MHVCVYDISLIMATDGAAFDTISCGSTPSSAPGSPKNRIKFLCSHGGKILPRPSDGHLKYVGGETRVISVPRDITFQELMKKLTKLIDGEMILKYQVVSEDLDALVSVKSDEDVVHMCDEIDRWENAGNSRLRAFLFPVMETTTTTTTTSQVGGSADQPHTNTSALEQRYIDAINGIIRSAPNPIKPHPQTVISAVQQQHGSLVSSGCSSPQSPDSCTTEPMNNNNEAAVILPSNYYVNSRMVNMQKVQSSPNICSIIQQGNNGTHYTYQPSPQYNNNNNNSNHYAGHQSPKPPIIDRVAPERLISVRSVGRAEGVRFQLDPAPLPLPLHYYSNTNSKQQQNRGGGYCNNCMHYDDCSHFSDRKITAVSSSSSRLGHGGCGISRTTWDSGEDNRSLTGFLEQQQQQHLGS